MLVKNSSSVYVQKYSEQESHGSHEAEEITRNPASCPAQRLAVSRGLPMVSMRRRTSSAGHDSYSTFHHFCHRLAHSSDMECVTFVCPMPNANPRYAISAMVGHKKPDTHIGRFGNARSAPKSRTGLEGFGCVRIGGEAVRVASEPLQPGVPSYTWS
jgi:hypothetical protein